MRSAQQLAELWASQMAGSVNKYKQAVQAVTENPMEKAAAAKDLWARKVAEAAENGRFEAGLREVPLQDWKSKTAGKGADRLATGARDNISKMTRHLTEWMPIAEEIKATCKGMPKGTTEDSVAKVRYAIEQAKRFKARRGR